VVFSFIFISCRESCLLVSWCAGDMCGMTGNGENHGRSRMPCVVYTVHVETRSAGFLVEPQNQGLWFVSGLASKPLGRFLPVWPQNRWQRFLPVWPQNWWRWFLLVWPQNWWLLIFWFGHQNWPLWFGNLDIKITVTVSLLLGLQFVCCATKLMGG
jgi:hypothetical protein